MKDLKRKNSHFKLTDTSVTHKSSKACHIELNFWYVAFCGTYIVCTFANFVLALLLMYRYCRKFYACGFCGTLRVCTFTNLHRILLVLHDLDYHSQKMNIIEGLLGSLYHHLTSKTPVWEVTKQTTLTTKMSIQYTVLGFELTTFQTQVSSHNH